MRKFTQKLCMFFLVCMGVSTIQAQDDVTATYLTNADFETDPVMATITSAEPANNTVHPVTGWITGPSSGYTKLFTLPYSTPLSAISNTLGVIAPDNGSSVTIDNNYLLAIKTHWNNEENYLEQTVTLPEGKYSLTWDSFVRQDLSSATSYCGYIIDETPTYNPLASALDTWTNNSLEFTLTTAKLVTIRFGYKKTGNTGGGASPVLFVDNVKLARYSADKSGLNSKIQEVQAIVVVDSPGEEAINNVITAALDVYDDASATVDQILQAIDNLDAAKAAYTSTALTDLQINGSTIANFIPTTLNYTYTVAPNLVPVVSASAAGVNYNATVNVDPSITVIPGVSTITVTAGNGEIQNYTITFSVNYIAGWDGSPDITTPDAAGWLSPNAITWSPLNTGGGRNCFRDGLASGGSVRALVGSPSNKYAYPLSNLTTGKIYTFTCAYKWISDGNGETRRWTFGANTAIDGAEETMLSKVTGTSGGVATATFSFVYSGGDCYLVWNGSSAAYAIDNLMIVEAGDAIRIEFESNGGSAVEKQYLMSGNKITEPAEPTNSEYPFVGWFTDEELTIEWDFNNTVSTDMILYAKWDMTTSIGTEEEDRDTNIVAVEGGIKVTVNQTTQVNVVTVIGQIVASLKASEGETFIQLPAGMYIVNGMKVLVK